MIGKVAIVRILDFLIFSHDYDVACKMKCMDLTVYDMVHNSYVLKVFMDFTGP